MNVLSTFYWVVTGIIWLMIAFWPARVAARKGHSFVGYFLFSLVFFPLALLVAYLSPNVSRNKVEPAKAAGTSVVE